MRQQIHSCGILTTVTFSFAIPCIECKSLSKPVSGIVSIVSFAGLGRLEFISSKSAENLLVPAAETVMMADNPTPLHPCIPTVSLGSIYDRAETLWSFGRPNLHG